MADDAFLECLRVFGAHDYERAANLALNLLQQRRFHWLYQVMLISLQRLGNDPAVEAMGRMAIDAFVDHAWETRLLRMTLEDQEIESDDVSDLDLKAKSQACFYLASVFLTRGQRAAARPLFEMSALTQAQCAETVLASSEVLSPEARTLTLGRVLSRCQQSFEDIESVEDARDGAAAFFRHATVAVEIREDLPPTPEPPDEQQELRRLASGLAGWLHERMSEEAARNLYDRLARVPLAAGQPPAVPRRVPAGPPPLRAVQLTLKQLTLDGASELSRAAIAFGFPLFLGRHPLMASAERPVHKLMRETEKDGREVSPFCRRRFSGDSSVPLPRTRYHAVCDPQTGDDGGTVVAEMMAYTIPSLTGYCAVRQAGQGMEIVFRGLPQEPNPFYRACSDPAGHEHVFRGLPAGNPLHALATLPSADNVLVLPMTTTTTELRFERCLDLRFPDAREWLIRLFTNPPDGLHGDSLRVLANTHRFDLRTATEWLRLLPVLIARTTGGNPLTDIVGAYLRFFGCDALVFPSARNDFYVAFSHGRLASTSGWNLVNYRGLDPVDHVGLEVGDPIEPLAGQLQMLASDDGETRGSTRLLGNRLTNRIINQVNYEYFLAARGPRWLVERKEVELFARSYLWYRKRYTQARGSFVGSCDQCGHSFTDPSDAVRPECPICGFQGDR